MPPKLALPILLLLTPLALLPASTAGAQTCIGTEPSPCLGALVVSEVALFGPAGASDEFVEIYNSTSSAVDASGVEIVYASSASTTLNPRATLPPSTIIPARSYYLATSTAYSGTPPPDLIGWSIGFSGSAGAIGLRAGNTVLDLLGWGSPLLFEGAPFTTIHVSGGSFERKASAGSTATSMSPSGSEVLAGNGFDSDANSVDFITRAVSEPQNSASAAEPPLPPMPVPAAGPGLLWVMVAMLLGLGLWASAKRSSPAGSRRLPPPPASSRH